MKKLIPFVTLLAIISCRNENQKLVANPTKKDSVDVAVKAISIDTIFFSYDEKWKGKDIALAYLLDKKYDADSVCTGTFKIDFKGGNGTTIFSKKLKIRGVYEESDWTGQLQLDSIASPLKTISYGYPACGYTQNYFLFYINKSNSSLVHQWYSGGDSGWGYWSEVVTGKPEDFYFRTQALVDDPKDEEMALNEFSDSMHFKLENNKWKKTVLTPKGKVYRSREVNFDEFYKQN